MECGLWQRRTVYSRTKDAFDVNGQPIALCMDWREVYSRFQVLVLRSCLPSSCSRLSMTFSTPTPPSSSCGDVSCETYSPQAWGKSTTLSFVELTSVSCGYYIQNLSRVCYRNSLKVLGTYRYPFKEYHVGSTSVPPSHLRGVRYNVNTLCNISHVGQNSSL